MADHFWPGVDPIGKRIGYDDEPKPEWWEIVGVVGNIRFPGNMNPPDTRWQVYRPITQFSRKWITVLLRTTASPKALTWSLQKAVDDIYPGIAVYDVTSGRRRIDLVLTNSAVLSSVLGAFAMLGLVLAAGGICGVITYSVAELTGEIGIRMALGAQRADVFWMVFKQSLRLCVFGVAIGLLGVWMFYGVLKSAIPETSIPEAMTFVGAALGVIATGLVSIGLPAHRAAKRDPMIVCQNR